MKAVVITRPGAPDVLQIQERPVPIPSGDQVLIRVKAAGVNRPDVSQRKGYYPAPEGAPADIPGLEVAGVVEACGQHVSTLRPGDEVCALITGGGYAEYAIAHAGHCLPIPAGWSFEEAASLPETVFTVWHNVFQRGRLEAGETLLVHGGSSGIGITAIQLAKLFGARVFTTAGSQDKCAACERLGAERCINYREEDFEEALEDIEADVILDMIGGEYIAKNINLLKDEGRLVFINAMQGGTAEIDVFEIMKRRLTITGSTLRSRNAAFKSALAAELKIHVWPLLERREFAPVIYKTFPLEQAVTAHQVMESSEHIGKLILKVA